MLAKSKAKQTKRIVVFKVSSFLLVPVALATDKSSMRCRGRYRYEFFFSGISTLGIVLGGDREAPSSAKCLLTDLQNWRRLLALVFTALDHSDDRHDHLAIIAMLFSDLFSGFIFLDVAFKNAIDYVIWRKRILISLIGTQLRRWYLLDRRAWDYWRDPISVFAQAIHHRFGHIGNNRQCSAHIAV